MSGFQEDFMRFALLFSFSLLASFPVCGRGPLFRPPLESGDGTVYFSSAGPGDADSRAVFRYGRSGASLLDRFGIICRLQGKKYALPKRVKGFIPEDAGTGILYSLSNVLEVRETVSAAGNGSIVIAVSLSNTSGDEVEVDTAFFLKPAKGYVPLRDEDGDLPSGIWGCRAPGKPGIAFDLHSGGKRRPLAGNKMKRFLKTGKSLSGDYLGKYSDLEIDSGKTAVVYIVLTASGSLRGALERCKKTMRQIKSGVIGKQAAAFRRNRLRHGRIPRFRQRNARLRLVNRLERFKSRLVKGWYYGDGGTPLENIRAAYAFMDFGFYPEAGSILKRLTSFFRKGRSGYRKKAMASYISLVLDYFMRSGRFRGSLKLAARFLSALSGVKIPEGRASAEPELAVALGSAFADGSQLMGYARQRSLQEKYSRLARKWIKHFRTSCRKAGDFLPRQRNADGNPVGASVPVPPKFFTRIFRGFAGRMTAWHLAGGAGMGYDRDYGKLARLAFQSGYVLLGRRLLKRSVFPSASSIRARAAALVYGQEPYLEPFSDSSIKRMRETLICLGRVSGPVKNCFPYRNAAARLRTLQRKKASRRERDLLRFVSTVKRLRTQVLQTVQEFSQRYQAMEHLNTLLSAGEAILARRYRLWPKLIRDSGSVTLSFINAPGAFVRGIRFTSSVTGGFSAPVVKSSRDFSLSLDFRKGRLRDRFGGARYLFRSRYRGVDFRFRHARVLRTYFPFRVRIVDGGMAGYRIRILNDHTGPLWDMRAVLSYGFRIPGGIEPPAPGKSGDYNVVCSSNQAYGDYPGVITAKVNGQTYSVSLTFRHGERISFGTWFAKTGDNFYWKNPEYNERGWNKAASFRMAASSMRKIHWVRSGFFLNETHRGRKKYIYLGPGLAGGQIYLNMTPLKGSGPFRRIPEGALLYNRRNVLAVRIPAGTPAGDRGRKPVVYVYGKE